MDGLLLTSRYSRHYAAEYDIAEGVAVIGKKGCRYFTDSRYIEAAENGIRDFQVMVMNRENPYSKLINDACRDLGITTLGYEEEYLTVAEFMAYKQKLELMLKELDSFPEGTRYIVPEGGLFIWVEMPESFNATELFQKAVEANVAYVPGTHFYPEGGHHNTLRLNFSNSTVDQIHTGMAVIREVIAEASK